jgi:hypothetical protein
MSQRSGSEHDDCQPDREVEHKLKTAFGHLAQGRSAGLTRDPRTVTTRTLYRDA